MLNKRRAFWLLGPVVALFLSCARDAPPDLELHEFVIRESSADCGNSFEGRGTLLVRGRAASKGAIVVVLQFRDKANPLDRNWRDCTVFVTDGVGTVETSRKRSANEKPPDYEWRVRGYSQLQSAQLKVL